MKQKNASKKQAKSTPAKQNAKEPTVAAAVVAKEEQKKKVQPPKVEEEVKDVDISEEEEENEVDEEEESAEEGDEAADDDEEEADEDEDEEETTTSAVTTTESKKRQRDETSALDKSKKQKQEFNPEALVHISNVGKTITEDDIKALFASYGNILEVRKPTFKPIAFVQFETKEEAEKAIAELNGSDLKGNKLAVAPSKKPLLNGNWITNLPLGITSETLAGYLTEIGKISSIVLFTDNRLTNTSSAGVVFESEVGKKALEYNGANIEGLACRIRLLTEDDFKVRIGNLQYTITEETLQEYMSEAGEIVSISVPKDEKGNGRGYAYVHFKTLEAVKNVLDYNGADINGRPCRIERLNLDDSRSRHAARGDANGRGRGGRGGGRGGRGRGGRGGRGGFEGGRGGRGRGGRGGGRGGRGGRGRGRGQ